MGPTTAVHWFRSTMATNWLRATARVLILTMLAVATGCNSISTVRLDSSVPPPPTSEARIVGVKTSTGDEVAFAAPARIERAELNARIVRAAGLVGEEREPFEIPVSEVEVFRLATDELKFDALKTSVLLLLPVVVAFGILALSGGPEIFGSTE